jgi:hypothetical protein
VKQSREYFPVAQKRGAEIEQTSGQAAPHDELAALQPMRRTITGLMGQGRPLKDKRGPDFNPDRREPLQKYC